MAAESPLLTVLIAAHNEERTLDSVLQNVLAVQLDLEVVAVDDGSTDRTWDLLQRWSDGRRVRVIQHARQRGKGAALRTAIGHARGTYVVIQDADMEYDPREYAKLVEPL